MIRLEFNSEGFTQILTSDATKSMISGHVDAIKTRADAYLNGAESEGFNARVEMGNYGGGRWIGFVGTSDRVTQIEQSENKILQRAVNG